MSGVVHAPSAGRTMKRRLSDRARQLLMNSLSADRLEPEDAHAAGDHRDAGSESPVSRAEAADSARDATVRTAASALLPAASLRKQQQQQQQPQQQP